MSQLNDFNKVNSSGSKNSSENSHHGLIFKKFVSDNNLTVISIAGKVGVSKGWVYKLFDTPVFNSLQLGALKLHYPINVKLYGIDCLEKPKLKKIDENQDSLSNLFNKFQDTINRQICIINKQVEMLETKDKIIAALIPQIEID